MNLTPKFHKYDTLFIVGVIIAAAFLALCSGCAAPVESDAQVSERPAMAQEALPIIHECASRSSIQVGAYNRQWANWTLTVDASNFAYAVVTTDLGVAVEAHGGMPLTIHFPGDAVDFTLADVNGWAGLTQPYPGLAKGYTVEVRCSK